MRFQTSIDEEVVVVPKEVDGVYRVMGHAVICRFWEWVWKGHVISDGLGPRMG